jgi:uncharacterized membrane protein
MELIYKAMLIWCLINFPFTFVFYNYGNNLIGSIVFLSGFLILCIVGLFQAHKEDKMRNIGV